MELFCNTNIAAFVYEEANYFRRSALANVGCRGTESNITDCCAMEDSSGLSCHSGTYAGVRCMCKCCV